ERTVTRVHVEVHPVDAARAPHRFGEALGIDVFGPDVDQVIAGVDAKTAALCEDATVEQMIAEVPAPARIEGATEEQWLKVLAEGHELFGAVLLGPAPELDAAGLVDAHRGIPRFWSDEQASVRLHAE